MPRTAPFHFDQAQIDLLLWTVMDIVLRHQRGPARAILVMSSPRDETAGDALQAALRAAWSSAPDAWHPVEISPCCWWCAARGRDHCPTA